MIQKLEQTQKKPSSMSSRTKNIEIIGGQPVANSPTPRMPGSSAEKNTTKKMQRKKTYTLVELEKLKFTDLHHPKEDAFKPEDLIGRSDDNDDEEFMKILKRFDYGKSADSPSARAKNQELPNNNAKYKKIASKNAEIMKSSPQLKKQTNQRIKATHRPEAISMIIKEEKNMGKRASVGDLTNLEDSEIASYKKGSGKNSKDIERAERADREIMKKAEKVWFSIIFS